MEIESLKPCISIVVPVYNEDLNIGACIRALRKSLADVGHEILICYDFAEDRTLPAIQSMPDKPDTVRLVHNTLGRGAAWAMRAGFRAARGDVIVTTMADLSDSPEIIPIMAQKIREQGADVVSGSRYMKGGMQRGGVLIKKSLSRLAGWSLYWFAGLPTHDVTNNFRAYRSRFLREVQVESRHGFELGLELTVKAHRMGGKVDEVASIWTDRVAGESRFLLWKWLPHYLRWYCLALYEPLIVWVTWLALSWSLLFRWPETLEGVPRWWAGIVSVLCFVSIVAARRVRGRMGLVDALFAPLWLGVWGVPNGKQRWFTLAVIVGMGVSGIALLFASRKRKTLRNPEDELPASK